jgi:hypothetical protein
MSICNTSDLVIQGLSENVTFEEQVVAAVMVALVVVIMTANLLVFVYFKRNYARSRVRITIFIITYYFAVLSNAFGYALPVALGFSNFPCWVQFFLSAATLSLFNAANFTRNSAFMLMTKLSMATYEFGRIPLDETNRMEEELASLNSVQRFLKNVHHIWFGLRYIFVPNGVRHTPNRQDHIRTLVCLRFITSHKGAFMFSLLCAFPYIILTVIVCLTVPAFAANCTGCAPDNDYTSFTIVSFGGALLLNAVFFVTKCRSLPDVWGVFAEGRLSARGIILGYIGFLLTAFTRVPYKYMFVILTSFGFCLGFFFASSYQILIAQSREATKVNSINGRPTQAPRSKSKRTRGSVGSDGTTTPNGSKVESMVENANALVSPVSDLKMFTRLNEILSSPELLRAFEYHLSTEFGSENLCFLQDVHEWRLAFRDVARTASLARARKICGTYISDKGLNQVNLPDDMREELVQKVNANTEDASTLANSITIDIFDRARTEIANLLEKGAVMRFSKTQSYASFIGGTLVVATLT